MRGGEGGRGRGELFVLFDNRCRNFKAIGSLAREKSRKTWNEINRSNKGTKASKYPAKDGNA